MMKQIWLVMLALLALKPLCAQMMPSGEEKSASTAPLNVSEVQPPLSPALKDELYAILEETVAEALEVQAESFRAEAERLKAQYERQAARQTAQQLAAQEKRLSVSRSRWRAFALGELFVIAGSAATGVFVYRMR